MAQFTPRVGIDCSDARLDVHIHPLAIGFSVANDPAGWSELDTRLKTVEAEIVASEASGGCERDVSRFLLARGYSLRLVDPYRVRQFAKAAGKLAKNDRIDAATIALFVATLPTRPMVRHKQLERLAELVTARAQLLEHATVAQNQARRREDSLLRRVDARRAKALDADIKLLDRRIAELVERGIGLNEFGDTAVEKFDVGVAPFEDQSGKRQGVRFIQGGRPAIRAPLFMAAMVAGVHNPSLKAFRDRLRAAGKKPKVAIVAVMRKMITTLNAILRDTTPWQNRTAP